MNWAEIRKGFSVGNNYGSQKVKKVLTNECTSCFFRRKNIVNFI